MMEPIHFTITEQAGYARHLEPVSLGVPLEKGRVFDPATLCLTSSENEAVPSQLRALAHWPDGSVRVLLVECLASVSVNTTAGYSLQKLQGDACEFSGISFTQSPTELHLEHNGRKVTVSDSGLKFEATHPSSSTPAVAWASLSLTDQHGQSLNVVYDHPVLEHDSGPIRHTVALRGVCIDTNETEQALVQLRAHFYAHNDLVRLDFQIHNPKAALHPGGMWDLGDPQAFLFRDAVLTVKIDKASASWFRCEPAASAVSVPESGNARLQQASSGGNNWCHENHVTARCPMPNLFAGYRCTIDGKNASTGQRANPIVSTQHQDSTLSLVAINFWQNFPGAIELHADEIRYEFFPSSHGDVHELQPGERKTQSVYLSHSCSHTDLRGLQSPLVPVLINPQFHALGCFPYTRLTDNNPLDSLVNTAIDGPHSIISKREIIDEYGWRNFGDLFADHETHYQSVNDSPLVSHYNNQYDPIMGFARMFLISGDHRWYGIMDDLARHVADIDIYHTRQDRSEYNGGLFWHTDHYTAAYTASHRTFSRKQLSGEAGETSGGGPGTEHCYTTGLMMHHFLTGNPDSREAVLTLTRWMEELHESRGGLLAHLVSIVKIQGKQLKATLRGQRPLPYRYPLTRGTGNYINALLDSYLLEGTTNYLRDVESVFRNTLHPDDDITRRDLSNIEDNWSYTVFLTALARYVSIKETTGVDDNALLYARDAFLHYTAWMLENESSYRSDDSRLEYPNDTWVAQDIRKCHLLTVAGLYDTTRQQTYFHRARCLLDDISSRLSISPERHYTRVVAILLQNYGSQGHLLEDRQNSSTPCVSATQHRSHHGPAPSLTLAGLMRSTMSDLGRGLTGFSLAEERRWLKARRQQ